MQQHRTEQRYKLLRRGKLVLAGTVVVDCTVHNISATGAGLAAVQAANLPENVELTLDGGRTFRAARVAWQLCDRAGLKFDARP